MKILAVDDDQIILEILNEALTSLKYSDVKFATSGTKALEIIEAAKEPFDCVMLDIQMPEMDGIEAVGRIREIPAYYKTPILMITSMSHRTFIDRAFAAGATDYVTKPFNIQELAVRINLAKRLNSENATVSEPANSPDALVGHLTEPVKPHISDSVDLVKIDRFLSFQIFSNYVAQLQRGTYFFSCMLALKIANIEKLYFQCNAADFTFLLEDVAEAISDNLHGSGSFVTYSGNGVFPCIGRRGYNCLSEDLKVCVEGTVFQNYLVFNGGIPMNVELIQGPLRSPSIFNKHGDTEIIRSVITDVEKMKLNEHQHLKTYQ